MPNIILLRLNLNIYTLYNLIIERKKEKNNKFVEGGIKNVFYEEKGEGTRTIRKEKYIIKL